MRKPEQSKSSQTHWPILTTYTGDHLARIGLPLGGVGTGTISLGGRGQLFDWEIRNRPEKGFTPPHSFFALWAKAEGKPPVTRVLEGCLQPPYDGAYGAATPDAGLPRFRNTAFHAAYPLAQVELGDPDVPISVRLEAFNPLIPLDADRSGLPVAVLRYVLVNRSSKPVKASIAGSVQNFSHAQRPGVNEYREGNRVRGLFLHPGEANNDQPSPTTGTLALATTHRQTTFCRRWDRPNWNNDILSFWDDFSRDGKLNDPQPAEAERRDQSSLACHCTIPAKSEKAVTFLLCWHFPHRTAAGCGWETGQENCCGMVGNYYATQFSDAWDVAAKIATQLPSLERDTVEFVQTLCDSTLPQAVKEAALNNLSTLRSETCFRTADGNFYGFEGCHNDKGCCFGSCTHVWNYEQATAFLFPDLARSMRRVELQNSTPENGLVSFRSRLPLNESPPTGKAAADGQMGVLMKLYREWQLSGDDALLRELYPHAKSALEFCWLPGSWDADQDGVMEGVQHNTYDVEFYGPNPMMGSWYLGALRAMEEMAAATDDFEFAKRCRTLFVSGSKWMDAYLFNGEYYVQEVRPVPPDEKPLEGLTLGFGGDAVEPDFQMGEGCLVDQLVGQYMSHVVGLGYLLDPRKVRKTMKSLFRYNFKRSLHNHWNTMRTYALNDESALLICTWPKGNRPQVPFPYFPEVMTGFEYQAAVHMIYEGMIEEGLQVIAAIRARYDGRKRSPWDEAECGHHYARAMASWAAIPALSGFHYRGSERTISFTPRIGRESFTTFWSGGGAWGIYEQKQTARRNEVTLSVRAGRITIGAINLGTFTEGAQPPTVELDGKPLAVEVAQTDTGLVVRFQKPQRLRKGQSLSICA